MIGAVLGVHLILPRPGKATRRQMQGYILVFSIAATTCCSRYRALCYFRLLHKGLTSILANMAKITELVRGSTRRLHVRSTSSSAVDEGRLITVSNGAVDECVGGHVDTVDHQARVHARRLTRCPAVAEDLLAVAEPHEHERRLPEHKDSHWRCPSDHTAYVVRPHGVSLMSLALDIQLFMESVCKTILLNSTRTGLIFRRKVPVAQMMAWQKGTTEFPTPTLTTWELEAGCGSKFFKVSMHVMGWAAKHDRPYWDSFATMAQPPLFFCALRLVFLKRKDGRLVKALRMGNCETRYTAN
ncbi:hypothetical protein EDC04DRAFT_2613149 [Pisolithus marmoratus]|nr:hypothetical protein EDC04DRAFT_2613149 [Pisolithus marmoratus]